MGVVYCSFYLYSVFTLVVLGYSTTAAKRECWWTGCQSSSWVVRGCEPYNKEEVSRVPCQGGDKFRCCSKPNARITERPDLPEEELTCWWTGCQSEWWETRGCEEHNKVEVDRRICDGGHEFYCCPGSGGSQGKSNGCWWTGCQAYSWGIRGCEQYNRIEETKRSCKDGDEFYCCPDSEDKQSISRRAIETTAAPIEGDCWWTACQANTGGVKGCAQYNKTEAGVRNCEGGSEFFCCSKLKPKDVHVTRLAALKTEPDCWWTGCQASNWAVRGCEQYKKFEEGKRSCEGGDEFLCCSERRATTKAPQTQSPAAADCWWTGCQPNTWGVRGCQQYERVEKDKRVCDDGDEFFCCADNRPLTTSTTTTTEATLSGLTSCWWTGCQPNTWGVRGCQQYERVEKDKRACDDGDEFYCCADEGPLTTSTTTTTEATLSGLTNCWWTGCQPNNWAVVGCGQYERVEAEKKSCKDGYEYKCCEGKLPEKPGKLEGPFEECVWSKCHPGNSSTVACPDGYNRGREESCPDGMTVECCGKPAPEDNDDDDVDSLTGLSYQDFVKYLFLKDNDFTAIPDQLKCEMVDPGKKYMLKVKDEGIRICDMCPNLPQKHLVNVYLNRVPTKMESNINFATCFGTCYEEKTCVAFSYASNDGICYTFDSTAGSFEEEDGWDTVLMTQPSGVIQDWTFTRHTRLLGYPATSSIESSFLKCLDICNRDVNCNYAGYSYLNNNCSLYNNEETVVYVDLVYGHIAAVRTIVSIKNDIDRFEQDGEDLEVAEVKDPGTNKCQQFKNETHGATYNQACLTGGSDLLGCDQTTGCKLCYYPENTEEFLKLSICDDSEDTRLRNLKSSIANNIKTCLTEKSCVGVGYNSNTGEVATMNLREYLEKTYQTKFMLKHSPDNDRKYLGKYDILPNADIKRISIEKTEFEEIQRQSLEQCLAVFEKKKDFTRVSYSLSTGVCKIAKANCGYVRKPEMDSLVFFRKPAILSSSLTYYKMPGFSITSAKPRAINPTCVTNCEEQCTKQCKGEYKQWCTYISIEHKPNGGAACQFYDDVGEFNYNTNENGMIVTRISSTDFSLESLNKWEDFQSYDTYNCFGESNNKQTQTTLAIYDKDTAGESRIRVRRGVKDFFKKLGKGIVDGFKQVGKAIVDTGKNFVKTVGNVIKGDFKAAGESFKKIPVVDLTIKTGELAGAVFTGDWDKAKEKGKQILDSDGFALVTSVGVPGVGGLVAQGGKAAIKAGIKAGVKQGGKDAVKGGTKKIDDIAKTQSRPVKGGKRPDKKNDSKQPDKKKDDRVEKERGEKCDKKPDGRRKKRAPFSTQPGKNNNCPPKKQSKNKCDRPRVVSSIKPSLEDCDNKKVGAKCTYECRPAYRESNLPLTCTAFNNRAEWRPVPRCTREDCAGGNSPLIVITVPQHEKYGSRATGDFITVYVVLFDKNRKLPTWSIALHQSKQFKSTNYNAKKDFLRQEHFTLHPCPQLKGRQAGKNDYLNSNLDRGHLTPANIARWSLKATAVLGLYINVAPQDPHTNQQPWEFLESHVECFSKRYRTIVATGICQTNLPGTAGKMKTIDVPACYWKMACYQDKKRAYQVVGFYAGNSKVTSDSEKEARDKQVLTPRSQQELLGLITGGFNNVWLKADPWQLQSGRPVPSGGNVWFPVNPFHCAQAMTLSDDEKDAWSSAFEDQAHFLRRGKNVKKPKPDGSGSDSDSESSGSDSDRRRRKRQADAKKGLQRGCHGSEFKSYLDQLGFFTPLPIQDGDGDDIGSDGGNKGEGDGSVKVDVQKCGKRIVGYYTSWGKKAIGGLELQRLTHVIYAFLEMKEDGSIIIGSPDRSNAVNVEEEIKKAKTRLENLMESAKRYPHLKVLFAVGGWENSQYFSAVAASPQKRLVFISAIVKMIDKYGFDGVDVDWEYPVTGGANEGVPADKQNYVQLMKELRTTLDNLADEVGRKEKFLISFAGAAGQWTLDPGYDLPELFKYIDFANIMTYDYFGAWASKWGAYTGPPAPLYFGMPPGFSGKTNADWSVKYYTCKTKQPHKINMGVPFYGRYWKNVGASVDGKDEMWRKAEAVNGKFEGGYVPWYEVKSDYLNNGAFQKKYHDKAQAPYAWNPSSKTFLGYEDEKSMEAKVKYAVDKNVGGLMIWALELDDDDLTLLDTVSRAPLCQKTDPKDVNHKCSPIDEKRWWTPEDGDEKLSGLCGRSAPLYKGYYPVCDPDDPGYSCCSAAGYCGTGEKFCDCPTCKDYRKDPKLILEEPIKPSIPVTWYLLNDPDGKRGRCGRKIPKIGSVYPTCSPDDENTYCCSNGGYCGNTNEHCKCDGCIDFKKNPKYQFGPKKWWTLEDGEDLGGQCGPKAPKVDGIYEAECEGTSKFHCCSPNGWCGSGPDFCDCDGCKNFKT